MNQSERDFHWPEYLMEAAGLGAFMMSACTFGVLLEHPGSSLHAAIPDPTVRRMLMGIAMGLTAVAIVYSPWGRRSGAHINPCLTLTFFRLGKVAPGDAVFYALAQFAGGATGVCIAAALLGSALADPAVNYVVTVPGDRGLAIAFAAEASISFLLVLTVLFVSNAPALARFTGVVCGLLVSTYITIEAPISGMSMNPARTFASALAAHEWRALWLYFVAPPLGMLLAAELYLYFFGEQGVFCAKLDHPDDAPCIFCAYRARSLRATGLKRRDTWQATATTT
ncbi:MAG TPA: aquaporin [Candidatus Binatia bacterium]|nr:aquaporin [Candidatus Binatia bacterium]